MRILVLNLYFPPDTSATAKMVQEVVNALREAHEVTVVCGRPSYEPTERHPWRFWRTEPLAIGPSQQAARVIRVGSSDYDRARMRRRLSNYLSYVALSLPVAAWVNCDVVLAMTDPPFEGIVGALVALLKRKPYVYNVRDLYPEMAVGGLIVNQGVLTKVWEALHRWALRRAKRVVVLGNDMRERIVAKGIVREKVAVVRDAMASSSVDWGEEIDPQVVRAIRADFEFVLVHAGNLGFYGAWHTLVESIKILGDRGIGLIFVGDGAQGQEIQTAAAGCKNVRFVPFFPASKIPSVLIAADVHVVTIRRGLEGVIVPSKMYGILWAGKPILAVAPHKSDVAMLGVEYGFGVWGDPDNPAAVASAIDALVRDPERVREMGTAARIAASRYDRVTELREFVRVLEEATRR